MSIPNFERIENFRDLGGYPCRYGVTAHGIIYRSGSPAYATEVDLRRLKELGIRSVIDLRGPHFNEAYPSPFRDDPNIQFQMLHVPNGDAWPKDEEGIPDWYLMASDDPYFIRSLFRAIIYAPKPLMIHCEAGKDRTGIFSALLLLANGVSKEDVVRNYNESYKGRLLDTERRTKELYPNLAPFVFHMKEDTFAKFVDRFLDRFGSMEEYFEAMGLNDGEIEAISNIFGVQETSAGAVVFHEDKVLVEHMALGHYSLPKGHVEKTDADLFVTARREIKEETGLDATIEQGFVTYSVYSPKEGHIKRVHWFIAEAANTKTHCQIEEVSDCYWLSPADAIRVLTHEDDRRVVTEVCNYRYR